VADYQPHSAAHKQGRTARKVLSKRLDRLRTAEQQLAKDLEEAEARVAEEIQRLQDGAEVSAAPTLVVGHLNVGDAHIAAADRQPFDNYFPC